MNKTLTALLALAALGAAHAQSGLKAGLWENRTTLMTVDGKDMAAVLRAAAEQQQKEIASLPPEQRKQAEAVLGRQGGDPLVRRVCISAEMARNEQLLVPRPARADCEPPTVKREGARSSFSFSCKRDGGTLTGKGESVTEGERISTWLETKGKNGAGKSQSMRAESRMKYLGSDCGDVKPLSAPTAAASAGSKAARQPGPAKSSAAKP